VKASYKTDNEGSKEIEKHGVKCLK